MPFQARIVELRIHGVSGTPPEQMLECAHTRQVAGDDFARFFVPVDAFGKPQAPPSPGGAGGREDVGLLEGFHWGRYTSGNWRQALWLGLIPFGLVNAAQFMLDAPHTAWQRTCHTVVGAALRLLALLMTVIVSLSAASISIDLLARQRLAGTGPGQAVGEGRVLVAGLLLAAAGPLLLYRLGRRNVRLELPPDPGSTLGARAGTRSGLTRAEFFAGDPDATSLGRLHVAGGVATVALVGVLTDGDSHPGADLSIQAAPAAAVLGVVAVLVTLLGDPEQSASVDRGRAPHERKPWRRLIQSNAVGGIAVAAAVLALVWSAWLLLSGGRNGGSDREGNPLAAVEQVSQTLVVSLTGCLLVLFAAGAVLAVASRGGEASVPPPFRRYAGGMAAPVVAATGAFLGVGYAAAFPLAVAELLGEDAELPPVVASVTFIWGITALLAVLLGILVVLGTRVGLRRRRRLTRAAYERVWYGATGPAGDAHHGRLPPWASEDFLGAVATATARARVKNRLPQILITFAAVGTLLALWMSAELLDGSSELFDTGSPPWVMALSQVGAWSLVLLAGLLMSTARQSIRAAERQRGVNVVWDVVSFWPRSVHPFVPPSYSQFAVQALRQRIRFHLGTLPHEASDTPADAVVVEAHSQGTFIAVAALLWLTPDELHRVALLSFGSQLQVIFPRAFPAFVSHAVLERLDTTLDRRWINLYRDTDPIAGPVLSWDRDPDDHDAPLRSCRLDSDGREVDRIDEETGRRECGRDWRLLDPSPATWHLQRSHLMPMLKHSHFPLARDWDDAVRNLVAATVGPSDAPDLPPVASGGGPFTGPPYPAPPQAREPEAVGPLDHAAHE